MLAGVLTPTLNKELPMHRLWSLLPALAFLACLGGSERTFAGQAKKAGVTVVLDGLQATAPAEWKEEEVTNKLRYKQFRLPAVKGDKQDAEIIIFRAISGSPAQNLQRWKDMFIPPEGKKIDEVAKVTEMKIGGLEAYYLDVHGTYKFKDRPFDPQSKEVRQAGTRMVAVQVEGKMAPYQIRFVGPAQTVEHYKKGFDDWLKSFK
jgi:hypothetical protein